MLPQQIVYGSIAVALVLGLSSLLLRTGAAASRRRLVAARWAWTAAWGALVLHVIAALAWYHGWSHAAAYDHTAQRTWETVGWYWGGGLWANYLLVAGCTWETAAWWRRIDWHVHRSRAVAWATDAYLAFMAFNATVVFGRGAFRWGGLAAAGLVLAVLLARRHATRSR
jgi:hypothetical protein